MATELGKAYVQIVPSAKGISGSITKELKGESESAGKSAGSTIASTMKKVFVAAGIGKALLSTIKEGGALEQSIGGIETLFKDNADTVQKYAQEAYKTVGVSANDYMENVTSFSASLLQSMGGDTEEAAKVAHTAMLDMGDNANKMGTDMRDIQNAYQGFAKENYTMLDNLKLGYGGTKSEMERLLADAKELTGVEYDISNLDDVFMAVHAIQEEIGITGTTALEAEETISGSFNAMKAAFQNTLGSLALGENIKPSLEGLAQSISTFLFGNLFPMIGTILVSLPSALAVFIQTMIPEIIEMGGQLLTGLTDGVGQGFPIMLEKINELIQSMGTWIQESLPQFLENGVDAILNLANGMMSSAPEVYSNIGDILVSVFNALVDAIPIVLEKGLELILGLAEGIINNLPAVMKSITDILSKLISAIAEKAPTFLAKGLELIKKLAVGLLNSLPDVINSISKILSNLISKIVEHLPELLKTGVKLIVQLAAGLIKAIPDVVSKIPTIIAAIVKAITGLAGELVGAGKDLMLGLAKGIGDSVGAVVNKAKEAAGKVVDSVKGFFGVRSPSRVFMEIGEYLNLGLAKGIEDNMKPVTRAMDELENITTKQLTKDLAFNASNLALSGVGDIQSANNYSDINRLISAVEVLASRDVVVAINGKEIARQTASDMSVELNNQYNSTNRGRGIK